MVSCSMVWIFSDYQILSHVSVRMLQAIEEKVMKFLFSIFFHLINHWLNYPTLSLICNKYRLRHQDQTPSFLDREKKWTINFPACTIPKNKNV